MQNITDRFPMLAKFDINRALEVGWKGYAQNVGMGALVLFVSMLLMMLAAFSLAGILFALPHLAAGLSLAGYYMAKGPLEVGTVFTGFRKYGRVLGATLIVWIIFLAITAVFSGPYYYHLIQAMSPENGAEGTWSNRFIAASLNPDVQNWGALQYLAYPFQFYFQGRFLPLYPLLVDEDVPVGEAFAHSWRMTSRVHWQLLLFMFLSAVLSLLAAVVGILGLVVGIFFTIPFPMALIGAGTRQLMESGSETNSGGEHNA